MKLETDESTIKKLEEKNIETDVTAENADSIVEKINRTNDLRAEIVEDKVVVKQLLID